MIKWDEWRVFTERVKDMDQFKDNIGVDEGDEFELVYTIGFYILLAVMICIVVWFGYQWLVVDAGI